MQSGSLFRFLMVGCVGEGGGGPDPEMGFCEDLASPRA
jgi:hypothetical protein